MFNRFYDDGSPARKRPQRHYAFREDSPPLVSENKWARFINFWSRSDLSNATNLVCGHVCADLTADEQDLLFNLRKFADVLLLKEDDPLHAFQMRLRSLHRLGMVNLSLPSSNASLSQLLARKRSLEASLRESKKRNQRHQATISRMHVTNAEIETELKSKDRLLAHAQAKLKEYQTMYPDRTEDKEELIDVDHEDVKEMFTTVDKYVDISDQMRYDPTGTLTCFWEDQRKQLSRDGHSKRWNPRVGSFIRVMSVVVTLIIDEFVLCHRFSDIVFFSGCRLETPSSNAYATYWFSHHVALFNSSKKKYPMGTVIGRMCLTNLVSNRIDSINDCHHTHYKSLSGELWETKVKKESDRDCILSWDATGYQKTVQFNKESGELQGFVHDPESFSCHQMFANKVNCFLVSSPEFRIKIKFPVAYYHSTSLNSAIIRQQWDEVMTGLDEVGLRVVCCVCDGASEHHKFFKTVLDVLSTHDPTITVRFGDMWVISDPPHLIKKFRNNWLSSGELNKHTKRLMIDGHLIGWTYMDATYTASTTLPDGSQRSLQILPKLKYDAIDPSSIQCLRVSLAAIPFSKTVQDFVRSNITRVAELAKVTEADINVTLKFSEKANELFQIMNSREPFTWTEDKDSNGDIIGLKDKLDTNHKFNLNWFSEKYGVSVEYLITMSGLPSGTSVPAVGSELIINRTERLLDIADYFNTWKQQVDSLHQYSKSQRQRMFITHWLYDDLRRTCYSMIELLNHYVKNSSRRWVPRRFTQDPIESLFGKIRSLAGSNINLDRFGVDCGMSESRSKSFKCIIHKM